MDSRNKKEKRILNTVANLLDLPADVIAGLPRLELIGSRQLYIDHHTGILSYSTERIDVNTTGGVLRVDGENLCLQAITADELRIDGCIYGLTWMR